MTKIAIQPNASGSGTFTLTAPDSNTNRTFTLPDATGEVYTSGNILGTVSESAGVPTGAIIERGSNSNGEFVRYADGTQICWRTFTIDSDLSFDNIFRTNTYPTWTFPAPFAERPVVSGSREGAATGVWASARNVTSTNCQPELLSSRSRTNQTIDFCAVGRWF